LGVVKACSDFGFCSGGDHVFDYDSEIEDGSIWFISLGGFVAQEKQTPEAASGVGN
jgi:hypothetical protein